MNAIAPRLSVVIPTFNNVKLLAQCLESWQTFAGGEPIEILVVEDGCRDETPQYLAEQAQTPWGQRCLRPIHETNVHELRATNRGIAESRAPLIMTWHDDMFLRVPWLVRELLAIFDRHSEIGLLCLSRGLTCTSFDEPIAEWKDSIDWRRLQSTIGPRPLNWFRLFEVDAVIRPWAIRREVHRPCRRSRRGVRTDRMGRGGLAFRIRQAGWQVAVHGYERVGAFTHLGSSTFTKYSLNLERDLHNGRLFFERWDATIRRDAGRPRHSWLRPMNAAAYLQTVWKMGNSAMPHRWQAILSGEG